MAKIRQHSRHPGLSACLLGSATCLLLATAALSAVRAADDALLSDVQALRHTGCEGRYPSAARLRRVGRLDQAAARWAGGAQLEPAALQAGYTAARIVGLHLSGSETALLRRLRGPDCLTLSARELTDSGVYRAGSEVWLVLATPKAAAQTPSPGTAEQVMLLVNRARARGAVCGNQPYGPAPPLHESRILERVAFGHARDMAENGYLEHADRAGASPADRVRAAGYREKLVGENIAFGPSSAQEVVAGWLASPGHCSNIMDPRFREMGVGYAVGTEPGRPSSRAPYWVQMLADPR